jgi:YD repeat-containing protein
VNTVLTRSWSWRADGLPEEILDSLRGARRVVSDRAGRVTAVSARDWSESYTYDDFGNVITGAETDALGAFGTAAGPAPVGESTVIDATLLRQAGRTHHEYDEAGRLVRTVRRTLDGRHKTWTYTWDSQDQLVRAETPTTALGSAATTRSGAA